VSEPGTAVGNDRRAIVVLGRISGAHGIHGWVKVFSSTEPREAIFEYQPWLLGEDLEAVRLSQGKQHGSRLIAQLEGVGDREAAEELAGARIAVYRDQLPGLSEGEFYWADLVGLKVRHEDGRNLGTIDYMLATGANDVMVVRGERERLIPFVRGQYVKQVDLERREVVVDWDPDF
jgi:16S rRNA processing protein RimM